MQSLQSTILREEASSGAVARRLQELQLKTIGGRARELKKLLLLL
jgi:hypothetical protein